jgi:hypothetical protein
MKVFPVDRPQRILPRIVPMCGFIAVVGGMIRMFIHVANSSTQPGLTEAADAGCRPQLTIAALVCIMAVVVLLWWRHRSS